MPIEGNPQGATEAELLRHAADIVIEFGTDGRILFVSEPVEAILGRPPEFYLGLSFIELVVPEDRDRALAAFQKMLETGEQPLFRSRLPRRDGLRIELECSARTFIGDDGRRRIVCIGRDTTQRSAEGAVERERNAYYRAISESGTSAAAVISPSGRLLYTNQRFKMLFRDARHLDDVRRRASETSLATLEHAWFHTTRSEGPGTGGADLEYIADGGQRSWFSARWQRIRSESDEPRYSMVFEDITQRKKVESALRSIALGVDSRDPRYGGRLVEMVGEALEVDRIVIGTVDPDDPDRLHVKAAWQSEGDCPLEDLELEGLPDAAVARGEACIHPKGVSQIMPAVSRRIGHGFESYAGHPLRSADGRSVGLIGAYSKAPLDDIDATRSLLSAYATHISAKLDRTRAQTEIRTNQQRFEALASNTSDMIFETDADGRILYASAAVETELGYTPREWVGRSVRDFLHPEDANRAGGFQESSKERQSLPQIHRVRHRDGSWRWLESKASTYTALGGELRTLFLARDVSDRHANEIGRDLLHHVVQQGADLVFVCEPDTTMLFANQAALRTLGAEGRRRVDGRRFLELLSEDDAERLTHEIIPSLATPGSWSGEMHLQNPVDDSTIATEATIFFFRENEETARTLLAITLRDITARRAAETALRESELRLGQAQKMEAVGRLAGGIAHDFNNLLTAIIGYADLVLDEVGENHVAHRDTEEILRAAERAGSLTRQLLAFSRRQVLKSETIDLNSIVADIDRMMRRLIGENIELVTLQAGDLRPILADPGQIEQVIVNLVVNARDAMPSGGQLELETANVHLSHPLRTDSGQLAPGHYVLLRVSDTGIGMDRETREQIFEPFFTTKEVHQGTGLGLATAYGIVNQSGGQIDVQSAPGCGAIFSIYLPAATATTETGVEAPTERVTRGHETILLVEDADAVRHLVQRTLEKNGYQVLPAESATAALRHCARHKGTIDLLISDVVLPKTSGAEIARRATELRPGLPVLFMSGFADETLEQHGIDANQVDLLEKPFTPAALLSRIRARFDEPLP